MTINIQERVLLNQWSKLSYRNAHDDLVNLRRVETEAAPLLLDERVRALRRNNQKKFREWREAALFCYGIGEVVLRRKVALAVFESLDFDFIARWRDEETEHYVPVQIKELPPKNISPTAELNAVISKLSKYPVSQDTVVVVHVNRRLKLAPGDLDLPNLKIAELWLMGATTPDQSGWFLWGNLLGDPCEYEFNDPS